MAGRRVCPYSSKKNCYDWFENTCSVLIYLLICFRPLFGPFKSHLVHFNPMWIVSHLPGGHLPPPKFGHFPPPNLDIYHPQKPNICQEDNCHPQFFFFFWRTFLGFSTYSSWRTLRMRRRRCLTGWSWSTSSRRYMTR